MADDLPKPKRLRSKRRATPHIPFYQYDVRDLFQRMGGVDKVHAGIIAHGWGAPQKRTIYRWWLRRSVPSMWMPFVLALAVETGAITDMTKEVEGVDL